jgi:hypothetical protein
MTIRATGDKRLDARLRALRAALRGLDGTDGRQIARRNARQRVLGALRGLRAEVDDRWPAIVTRAGVRRLKTFEGKLGRLTGKGWEIETDERNLADYAIAGVPVRKIDGTNRSGRKQSAILVPGWAHDIGPKDVVRLKAAKRSNYEKRVARAEAALRD